MDSRFRWDDNVYGDDICRDLSDALIARCKFRLLNVSMSDIKYSNVNLKRRTQFSTGLFPHFLFGSGPSQSSSNPPLAKSL